MRAALRRAVRDVRFLARLRMLPLGVALFQWRAHRHACRSDDRFSLVSATRPGDLAVLLSLAENRRRVVELGTGTGWTAIALALADAEREVITYDLTDRPERKRYLALVHRYVRGQITFVNEPGSSGPRDNRQIDLLYIDSAHERQVVIDELRAWRSALREGAVIVLDDFNHPEYPGIAEAIRELGLEGHQRGTMFVLEP